MQIFSVQLTKFWHVHIYSCNYNPDQDIKHPNFFLPSTISPSPLGPSLGGLATTSLFSVFMSLHWPQIAKSIVECGL